MTMTDEQAKRLFESIPDASQLYVLECKRCGRTKLTTLTANGRIQDEAWRFAVFHECKPNSPDTPSPTSKAQPSPDCTAARCADGSNARASS